MIEGGRLVGRDSLDLGYSSSRMKFRGAVVSLSKTSLLSAPITYGVTWLHENRARCGLQTCLLGGVKSFNLIKYSKPELHPKLVHSKDVCS